MVITVDEPENRVPSVTLEASPTTGNALLDVTFTATASDPDGDTLSINWDLGNAESLQDSLVQTVFYENAGTYEVSVTVTDGDGASASASITVVVDEPLELPEPRINASSTSAFHHTPCDSVAATIQKTTLTT